MQRLSAFAVATGVFLLDRAAKLAVEAQVSPFDTIVVIPKFFNIVHTTNRGMAFGLLNEASGQWRDFLLIGVSAAAMILISVLLWRRSASTTALQLGLAFILGGDVGNLYDRIVRGSVTDFLEFYAGSFVWPAFNVADSAVCVGAGLLILDMFHSRRQAVEA